MDLYGGGWYLDDDLMRTVADLRALSERLMEADRTPRCETAVIVSKRSFAYLRQDESLTDASIGRQISEIAHSGFPFDAYLAEDLPLLLSRSWSTCYRFFLFLNSVYVSSAEWEAIHETLKGGGRTVLWIHAAGLAGASALDVDRTSKLTGLGIQMGDPLFGESAYPLMVETSVEGRRVVYGAGGRIGPVLHGADELAEIMGWLIHPNLPGLLYRDFGSWQSIWSAAPNLPAVLLRAIARKAGVHVYDDLGDQVQTGGGVLSIHAAVDGEREIRLPARADVSDAITGVPIAHDVDHVRVSMERGDTVLWRTEYPA